MKIGILTAKLRLNYGGILQAYALQTILKGLGHEAVLIARPRSVQEQKVQKHYSKIAQHVQPFIDKHIVPQIKVKSLYHLNTSNFDAIIVGSDQVWRGKFERNIANMFLDFVKDSKCKKIAYAASFGISHWDFSPKRTAQIATLAKEFDAISVREDSGVTLCRDYLGVNASHVLDPTMLLTMEDYIQNFNLNDWPWSKGQLLVYLLDITKNKKVTVKSVALNKNYTPLFVNVQTDNTRLPIKKRILFPLERLLRGFYDGKFVVTDSFHGCVFSIIFNKPFIAYGNKYRGMARFISLLKMFKLENRLIFSSSEVTKERLEIAIDWVEVNEKLQDLRYQSKFFLISALAKHQKHQRLFQENEFKKVKQVKKKMSVTL